MENENIILAAAGDVEEVGRLYDAVNDYFERTVNYCRPNW